MLIDKPVDIAQLFKLHRKQRGLTQARIAKKTETRQDMVSKLENQPENIRLKELMNLMSALDLELYVAPKPKKKRRGDW